MPKLAWQTLGAALLLALGFWVLTRYGRSKYDEGRRMAQVAHTDSVRREVTRAVDSVHQVMAPVLEGLLRERDSSAAIARRARLDAAQAVLRSQRLDSAYQKLASEIAVTPPEVRDLLDQYRASEVELRRTITGLMEQTVDLQTGRDAALAEAEKWRALQEQTRRALDTAAKEVAQLSAQRKPPRCGWKCGFTVGALTVTGFIATLLAVSR